MKRQLLVTLALALAVVPAFAAAAAAEAPKTPRTLAVTGTAEVKVTPDICYLSFGITSQDKKSAAHAYQADVAASNAVIAAIKAQGIEAKDIQTSNLTVAPQYHYDDNNSKRTFDGYTVSHTITVNVRDLDKVSPVLDAAVTAGATEVDGVDFTVENPKRYLADARVEAINAARDKAEKIAATAGVTLGKPLTISEVEPNGWNGYYAQANASLSELVGVQGGVGGAGRAVEPGQTKVTYTVYITYEIE